MPAKKKSRKSAAALAADKKAREVAIECARLADERRGTDIVLLHIEAAIFVTDYFLIVSARNKRQIQSIAMDVREHLRDAGYRDVRLEGYEEASWVLIDAGSIIVHIFREDLRSYYDLELLWGDSPKVEWQVEKAAEKA